MISVTFFLNLITSAVLGVFINFVCLSLWVLNYSKTNEFILTNFILSILPFSRFGVCG